MGASSDNFCVGFQMKWFEVEISTTCFLHLLKSMKRNQINWISKINVLTAVVALKLDLLLLH